MLRRALSTLVILFISHCAFAAEVRIAVPQSYLEDTFLKSLLASNELADIGIQPAPLPSWTDQEATDAVKSGAADLVVFSPDRPSLDQSGSEAGALLGQPFMFKSAADVIRMQQSFLKEAAVNCASRSGFFPLELWNHSITYFLTKEPIRTEADFNNLKIAADANQSTPSGPITGFKTQLDSATQEFVATYGHRLYLTIGWPTIAILAAAPNYWLKLGEAEKKAWQAAAAAALAASNSKILAREDAIRKNPNIEMTNLGHSAQIQLAKHAADDGAKALEGRMDLWRKAQVEVASQSAGKPAASPAPRNRENPPVLFVTDRNDNKTLDYATRFGSRRLEPFGPTCGVLGVPSPSMAEPTLPPAPKALPKGESDCVRLIVEQARASGSSKVLFLIHGFNNSFEYAATSVLKLAANLNYAGTIVAWSWPSEGSAFGYAYDEDSLIWSEPHLARLVRDIAEAAPDLQLDFAAHSMGSRMLLQILRDFGQARANLPIGEAVFAAADIAQDVFKEQIKLAQKVATIRTLYASEYDRAILISESYHRAPRAGSGGADILVIDNVESVDVEISGHSYVFDEPKALHDFKQIVDRAITAARRGLVSRVKDGATYWVIQP